MEGITPISRGEYSIKLLGPESALLDGIVRLDDLGGSSKLTLTFGDRTLTATSSDFFDALVQLRRRLEKEGLLPVCYGASRHVYPTALARAAAHGLMAMRWTPGKRRADDLVFIFHTGPDVEPATVAEQREFYQSCVAAPEVVVPLETAPQLAA
jgi:hypothetical protein